MATTQARKFTSALAQRTRVPLIIGIAGPSGTGKTKSALRLADGMKRVDVASKRFPVGKGETFVVDTEGGRGLHFAKEHEFQYVGFPAPHSPVDYLTAIEHCIERGAGRIIIDSLSHEHDGEGGVRQWHAKEMERFNGDMRRTFEAWAAPKQARRTLINRMVACGVDVILCLRADRKIKPVSKKQPIDLGFTPIGGKEFMFEMTVKLLLLPGAAGVPTFRSDFPGEREAIKLPGQFEALFERRPQLSEDIGEQLARWAGGGDVTAITAPTGLPDLLTRLGACSDADTLALLDGEARALWKSLDVGGQKRLEAAGKSAHMRVKMLAAQAAEAARAMADAATGDEPAEDEQGYGVATEDTAA